MKAYEIQGSFGFENLRLVDRPDPSPGEGEVVVKVKAVSLNFRDILMIRGHYNPKQSLPLIPCSDGVGEVVAVGDGVERVAVGDRVAGTFSQTWMDGPPTISKLRGTLGGPIDGMLAEMIVLSEQGVVRVPEYLEDAEAATLPCAGLTAWSALIELGGVSKGDTVLVQGSGGVSVFALQIATALGARVIATSSSDAKMSRLRDLGAWETVNYKEEPEWGTSVRTLTDGAGVDHVIEVGGAGTLAQSVRAVGVGGTISVIGVLSGVATELNIIPLLMQQVRLQGLLVGSRAGFERMNRFFADNRIKPVVDRVFPFSDALDAFDHMASGGHFGKVCITLTS